MNPGKRSERAPAALPAEIREPLIAFRRRILRQRRARTLGWAALAVAGAAGAALALDRFFILPFWARAALTAGTLSAGAAALLWSLAALLRRPGWLALARGLEWEEPGLEESLLSAVEVSLLPMGARRDMSEELRRALCRSAAEKARAPAVRRGFGARGGGRILVVALLAWVAILLAASLEPRSASLLIARFFHPLEDLPRPSTVLLEIVPGHAVLARGSDAALEARVRRGSPREAAVTYRSGNGPWVELRKRFSPGDAPGAAFVSHRFTALTRSVEYRVTAGDFQSPVFRIDVRDPPEAAAFRITFHPPPYTRLPRETIERSSGDITALRGTHVDIEIEATEPLSSAAIEVRGEGSRDARAGRRPLTVSGKRAGIEGLEVSGSGSYRLFLEAASGVSNGEGASRVLRAIEDRPPVVEVLDPRAAEVTVEASSLLDIRCQAADDVGLESLDLLVTTTRGGEVVLPLGGQSPGEGPRPRSLQVLHRLDVAALGLRPGESAPFRLRAVDALGQESLSPETTLRASYIPEPPEGRGWPAPLAELEGTLQAALEAWTAILPIQRSEAPEAVTPDPALAERFVETSERTLAVAALLAHSGEAATDAGRAIAVPSPNHRALENLGRLLRRTAALEVPELWAETAAVTGAVRAGVSAARTETAPTGVPIGVPTGVPIVKLLEAHGAAGSRIEEALSGIQSIHRAEEVEETVERCLALLDDAGAARAAGPERGKVLFREAAGLAASLTVLARRGGPSSEILEGISRRILEAAAAAEKGDAAGASSGADEPLRSAAARLLQVHEREAKLAAEARARLEPRPLAGEALEGLAGASSPAEALLHARRAFFEITEDLRCVEGAERADLESSTDLAAFRDLLEPLAEEGAAEPASGDERSREAAGILAAHRATSPSRRIGRVIEDLARAAAGEEDLAWRLRGASPWNRRALRSHARTQVEIRGVLAAAREILEPEVDDGSPLARGIAAALAALDDTLAGTNEVLEALSPLRAAESGELAASAVALAARSAARSARLLAETAESLEVLRSTALPEAARARAWLAERLGTLPARIATLARRLSAHSGRVRDLSADASGPESDSRAASLLLDAEDLRRDTAALSVRARREGARGLASGTVERSRLHDQAAVQLAATATEDLTRAVRALRASDADAASRPGLLLEASTLEAAAAERLETIARALEALEAGEALSAAARNLEDALAPGAGAGDGAGTPDPETTARVARLYLDMCLRASERLAPLRQGDPRWGALLDGLREAAQLFQKAIQAASGKDGAGAARLVAEGRARVEEVAALAKKLRGESEGALAEALSAAGPGRTPARCTRRR